ncbi:hypothetical protein FB45DRAFT_1040015 [Roridomyces roridus]|uniref:Uncharacterized protein n=1 Tax=Roridomyces roridus TaxID=1738132 RepID=A0AAD7B1Q0_9AGAR|nr:hypothetical protein FB45DRAFT_1040015 [Roridomyces roridus]
MSAQQWAQYDDGFPIPHTDLQVCNVILSDGEGFDFEPFVPADTGQESDSDPEDDQDDLPTRPPSPPSRLPTPAPPPPPGSSGPIPGTKFTARPPWRSIPIESVRISKLKISLQFIEALESACKENSQLSAEDNERLWNPPCTQLNLSDPAYRQALHTFMGADGPVTEATFNAFRTGHQHRYRDDDFPSFWKTKKKLEEITGVRAIEADMCPRS